MLEDYLRKKLEKLDAISDAVIYIKSKMEVIEEYGVDIKNNSKDINSLGTKVRVIEMDIIVLKNDLTEIIKKTNCQDVDIKSIENKSTGFVVKLLLGVMAGLLSSVIYLAQKIGIF